MRSAAYQIAALLVISSFARADSVVELWVEFPGVPGRCWIDPFGCKHCTPATPVRRHQGSAVCIGFDDGQPVFVTAAHAFRGDPPAVWLEVGGDRIETVGTIRRCSNHDFATFKTEAFDVECVQIRLDVPRGPAIAEGFGRGAHTRIDGTIAAGMFRAGNETNLYGFNSSRGVDHGMSGGAVLVGGELVGIVTTSDLSGFATFVSVAACHEMIERNYPGLACGPRIEPQPDPVPTPTPVPEVTIDYDLLAAKVVELMTGDERFRGPPGRDGTDGANGTSPTIDYDAIADAVVERLPARRYVFDADDPADRIVVEVPADGTLTIPPFRLQLQGADGSTSDRSAPLGGDPIAIGFTEEN